MSSLVMKSAIVKCTSTMSPILKNHGATTSLREQLAEGAASLLIHTISRGAVSDNPPYSHLYAQVQREMPSERAACA